MAAIHQLSENLNALLRASDMSQSQLAHHAGVHPKVINRLINNDGFANSPTLDTLETLAGGLGLSVAQLISSDFEPKAGGPVSVTPQFPATRLHRIPLRLARHLVPRRNRDTGLARRRR